MVYNLLYIIDRNGYDTVFGLVGTFVNVATVLAGGAIGLAFKKGIPQRMSDSVFKALGLITMFIGISGSLCGENTLIAVISMILGTIIGELIDLDKRINNVGKFIERKVSKGDEKSSVAQGFVSSCLLFCVGAMTIVGSLQAGLDGDCSVLFTKSAMDFCSSIIFASTLGIGVLFSSIFVLAYQGLITVLATWVEPLLTTAVVNEMNCVGYIIIIGLALNILGITKLKVMNMVPAIFLPIGIVPLYNLIAGLF
ncbi:MAG: DUF554 domain-containing protein [Ruminococcus sp.]|nr:DUF554 domain-containing protein [Ruminococcus sp.]